MRRLPPLVLGVLAVASLAGCGQSNPELIPSNSAQALQQAADKIAAACSSEDRSEARAQVRVAEREIDSLPRAVDARLKQNLQDWVDRIQARIPEDCRAEETPTPTPEATEPPPEETATAEPTATETPEETATAEPTPTATEPPPEEEPTEPTPDANGGVPAPDGDGDGEDEGQ